MTSAIPRHLNPQRLRVGDRVRHRLTGERGHLLKIGSETIRSVVVLWDAPTGRPGRPQRGIGWLHDLEELASTDSGRS